MTFIQAHPGLFHSVIQRHDINVMKIAENSPNSNKLTIHQIQATSKRKGGTEGRRKERKVLPILTF